MEVKTPEQSRLDLIKGQQQNAATDGALFPSIRIDLSVGKNRFLVGGDNYIGSGVKSFWVSDTNDKNFKAKIVPNPSRDRNKFSGLPLKYNSNQKFRYPVNDCCIEFESQPGKWIEISYSESEDIDVSFTDVDVNGQVYINEGSSHSSVKVTSTNAGAELISASDSRAQVTLQNKGGESVWVGNNNANELQHADWKIICHEVGPGGIFTWKNSSSLHGRSDNNVDLSCLTEAK